MQRILAWVAFCAFEVLSLATAALHPVAAQELSPQEWGTAQHKLGTEYLGRADGDRADNVEKAIVAFESALIVRTRETAPQEWATTQFNLGYFEQ